MIPELFPTEVRNSSLSNLKLAHAAEADHVICVSHSTKNDLLRIAPISPENVSVIHLGVSESFAFPRNPLKSLPSTYLLYVGRRGGYKNFKTLLRAFSQIAHKLPELYLVCVGDEGLDASEEKYIAEKRLGDRIVVKRLSETELISAYQHARAFVFPSIYEGFGLPALEALLAGCPVIAARTPSLTEIGGDTLTYFDPQQADELVEALLQLSTRDAPHDPAPGRVHAQQFSWSKTVNATASLYARLSL